MISKISKRVEAVNERGLIATYGSVDTFPRVRAGYWTSSVRRRSDLVSEEFDISASSCSTRRNSDRCAAWLGRIDALTSVAGAIAFESDAGAGLRAVLWLKEDTEFRMSSNRNVIPDEDELVRR